MEPETSNDIFFFELCTNANNQFLEFCQQKFKAIFGNSQPINGEITTEIAERLNEKQDTDLQIFMRLITNGSIIERDRLLEYSCYNFYNEMNLFILSNKDKK